MIRVGIVGCGYWGINYVRVFSELAQASVVMRVCDLNEERLRLVHHKYSSVFPTRSLEELLSDRNIDAVVVSTPAVTHYEVVKACLLLKNKHVLVEKPLSMQVKEGRDLVQLAEERQRILMVGHTFLYNPGHS